MPNSKHYIFSARTTETGLRLLNQLKLERGLSWDELVIDAVCAHYGLDKADIAVPKDTRREEERARKRAEKEAAKKAKKPKRRKKAKGAEAAAVETAKLG